MKYAVSFDHLVWEEADSEEEAIEKARQFLADATEEELKVLDFSVVDSLEE